MPLRGKDHSQLVKNSEAYFDSIQELDVWSKACSRISDGVVRYTPRTIGDDQSQRGRLLGGYTESPVALSYTFNFWSICDTFIYFSHHRVTIPPPGWINAAHRQGVKILGTLIFEGSGEADCLRLLVGNLPTSITGPAVPNTATTLPLSSHYACLLAELAHMRGFDGYLLNFECPLQGGVEQTRTLAAWNSLLQSELLKRVGAHAQTVWYDSVIVNGQLRWQDRLNSLNLPFFSSSSSIFTNYTWPPEHPSRTAEYFLSLEPTIIADLNSPKSLRDIFVGIDVWGRGSHGGGGFGCFKALEHIDPRFLGLSVALFGHAWTWESEQDKEGWSWDAWWAYERRLWIGPEEEDEVVKLPEPSEGEENCTHTKYLPICDFFERSPPPDPINLTFHTTFSPGVGHGWWVNGTQVLWTNNGWTDVDKQTSIGDLLWPRPQLLWEGDHHTDEIPRVQTTLNMSDAWNGGSSIQLHFSGPGSEAENAFFRCIWLPVQSLELTSRRTYEALLVFKTDSPSDIDVDLGVNVKLLNKPTTGDNISITSLGFKSVPLADGWSQLAVEFTLVHSAAKFEHVALGIVIGFAATDPSVPYSFQVTLGQINVYPSIPPGTAEVQAKVIWADLEPSPDSNVINGALTWGTATTFPSSTLHTITSSEDPQPAWPMAMSPMGFAYFNIYAQSFNPDGSIYPPNSAIFIGTNGLNGVRDRFWLEGSVISEIKDMEAKLRIYVQGVTDRGKVLDWEHCTFVDVERRSSPQP